MATTMNCCVSFFWIVVLLAALGTAGGCSESTRASGSDRAELTAGDRQAIKALASHYSNRALAGDFQEWIQLFHPDAVRMNPGQPSLEGRESIRRWVDSADFSVRAHEMSPMEVEGTRDIAYVRGIYRSELSIVADGEEMTVPDEGSWLAVVRRDDSGTWRFYRFMSNSDLAPVPGEGGG